MVVSLSLPPRHTFELPTSAGSFLKWVYDWAGREARDQYEVESRPVRDKLSPGGRGVEVVVRPLTVGADDGLTAEAWTTLAGRCRAKISQHGYQLGPLLHRLLAEIPTAFPEPAPASPGAAATNTPRGHQSGGAKRQPRVSEATLQRIIWKALQSRHPKVLEREKLLALLSRTTLKEIAEQAPYSAGWFKQEFVAHGTTWAQYKRRAWMETLEQESD